MKDLSNIFLFFLIYFTIIVLFPKSAISDTTDLDAKELNKIKIIQREELDIKNLPPSTPWQPTSSRRECNEKLAGYGNRPKAVCYDLVNLDWRGPLMVVIPANKDLTEEFAISKYEISIGDFSKYCVLSGHCKPVTDRELYNMPLTNINIKEVKSYLNWLSDRTGKTYRLPTPAEWEYAASGGGKNPISVNCVTNDGLRKSVANGLVSVNGGHENGWGLVNYLGNVEEWVEDSAGTLFVKGGTYLDECNIHTTKTDDGEPKELTGIRPVLVLDN